MERVLALLCRAIFLPAGICRSAMRSGRSRRSITSTWTPARATSAAASSPVGPAPMINDSGLFGGHATKYID